MSKDIITRKQALKQIGGLTLAPAFLSSLPAISEKQSNDKPNFLWIITEDCGASHFGCYGNENATTPNIDKLAAEGILYENACCSCPVCSPSRSTFMTGVYANSSGTQNMRSYNAFPDFIHFYPYYLEKAGYYCTNHSKLDYNSADKAAWKSVWDESSRKATYRDRASGQSFHETITLMNTHEHVIFDWIPKDKLKHKPERMRVPAYLPATTAVKHDFAQYLDKVQEEDAQVGAILDQLEKDGVAENTIVFLFADHGGVLPRSKRFLFDSGMHIPLIVRFPEKYQHLAPAKPGAISDRLVNSIDLAPTLLSLAGIDIPSYYQGQSFAGKKKQASPQYIYGFRNRMDETYDNSRTVRDGQYRYIRHYMPNRIYGQYIYYMWKSNSLQSWQKACERGLCNKAQSKFWHTKPSEELYDIREDPDNVGNLADNPDYENVLKRMRKANAAWIRRIHDSGFMPESMMMRRAKKAHTTIYQYVRSTAYPQEKVISMGEMASTGKPENLKNLMAGFSANDAAVRYWAAYGCSILGKKAVPAKQKLASLLDDPAPEVAIAASEALYHLGATSPGLKRLKKSLHSKDDKVRLLALNVIRTFGADAMPLLPELEVLEQKSPVPGGDDYGVGLHVTKYIIMQLIHVSKGK
jgi:arylsulfatase A-like enzyme